MKAARLIPIVIPALLAACLGGPKKPAATADDIPIAPLLSELRPGAELTTGTTYRDTVVYLGYDCRGDYASIDVERDGRIVNLLTESDGWEIRRGDQVLLEWKMDSMWVAGDGDAAYVMEWAKELRLIEKGPLARWERDFTRPIEWNEAGEQFSLDDDYVQACREAALWYFSRLTPERDGKLWYFLHSGKGPVMVSIAGLASEPDPEHELWDPITVSVMEPFDSGEGTEYQTVSTFEVRFPGRRFVYGVPDANGDYKPVEL